jgi:hypothetical protein
LKRIILILLFINAISAGCKYEEGPKISFRSAENRLYGNYILNQYTVNGEDSLSYFNDSLGLNFSFYFDEQDDLDMFKIYGNRSDGVQIIMLANWTLTSKSKNLNIINLFGNSIGTGPLIKYTDSEWVLLRLTDSEVKMKTNYSGKEYIIFLVEH